MTGEVLVIDDDPQLTEAMRRVLGEWGYAAITADGLDAAVEAAAKAPIGLVITDYQLGPRTTGVDAIAAIRQRIGRDVPAIVVTGDTSARAAEHARSQGIPLLLKPVDATALLALVEEAAQADFVRNTNAASFPA